MTTSFAHLALFIVEDCDADKAWQVRFWSAVAIPVLFLQFGGVALVAVFGSLVGLTIIELALRGARDVRSSINENSTLRLRDRAESTAIEVGLIASAARGSACLMHKSFCAVAATFAALGVAHVSLSTRLFPCPELSCA